jgi:hypothetical protein
LTPLGYFSIFETLLIHFKTEPIMYEIKLSCFEMMMPLLQYSQAESFMKIIENVLNNPAEESIFKANSNPLRICLMILKITIDI